MILELSVIGVIVSSLFIMVFGFFPGGIIVPVYFSLYLFQPSRIIITLVISILAVFIFKLLATRLVLFGRRRFVFMIVLASFLALLFNAFFESYSINVSGFQTIGILIPGLLANNLYRQGFLKTLSSLFIVSTMVFFIYRLVFLI